MTLTLGQLRRLLDERECGYSDATVVQATTPHHSYTFGITYLTGSIAKRPSVDDPFRVDVVTLHLVGEVPA